MYLKKRSYVKGRNERVRRLKRHTLDYSHYGTVAMVACTVDISGDRVLKEIKIKFKVASAMVYALLTI